MYVITSVHKFKNNNIEFGVRKKTPKKTLNKMELLYNPYYETITGNIYEKPVKLKKALYDILQCDELAKNITDCPQKVNSFLKDLANVKNFLNKKVIGLIGFGRNSMAFETPSGKVIKLTQGNHFPLNRPLQEFDVPVYQKGHFNKTYYYIEEKLYQHALSRQFVVNMMEKIKENGFKPFDMSSADFHQIGISKAGKLYLADPECAEYKTIFHAVWDKFKTSGRKIIKLVKNRF